MAVKLRLVEKEILEKAVKSTSDNRKLYSKRLEDGDPLPKYEESNIAFLENSSSDSKLPLVLRNLDEEDMDPAELKIQEALTISEFTENGYVNRKDSLLNGTKSESSTVLPEEEATKDAKEISAECTDESKVQLWTIFDFEI